MQITFDFIPTLVFAVVMLCWFVFAGTFLLRNKPPSPPDQKREPASLLGVALQGLSYAIVWVVHRPMFTPPVSSFVVAIVASVIAVVAAIGSVWLVTVALKTLGKEWSLTARLVEGHQLATAGPYAYVRHPIYTGMLGMLLATCAATTIPVAVPNRQAFGVCAHRIGPLSVEGEDLCPGCHRKDAEAEEHRQSENGGEAPQDSAHGRTNGPLRREWRREVSCMGG